MLKYKKNDFFDKNPEKKSYFSWCFYIESTPKTKHRKNCKKLDREHLIGCRGVKLFLLKDVTITNVTTATVTAATLTTVTILVFEFFHNLIFFSFVTI